MRIFRFLVLAMITVAAFVALNRPIGLVPPLGKFLSPFSGFWRNGSIHDRIPDQVELPGLSANVTVVWDSRMIPHIFADNDHDLYLAQGFVTARHRLWQMEFQTLAAAGRLSEVLGERTVEYDRFQRRIGMLASAEQGVDAIMSEPETRDAINAYLLGVNHYISTLTPADLPVEYKLLDYKPQTATPLQLALLLKYFQYDLTFNTQDFAIERSLQLLDAETFRFWYPTHPPYDDPIVPKGTRWNFKPIAPRVPQPTPHPLGQHAERRTSLDRKPGGVSSHDATPQFAFRANAPDPNDGQVRGSNNWAVAPDRTLAGNALLAFDPHLTLYLPSLWYEVQLHAPGINVYGVTPPGTPGVVFGFNQDIAWGATNAEDDLIDWYRLDLRDDYREYRYQENWLSTSTRFETIKVRGKKAVVDTVYYSHHGPVVYRDGEPRFFEAIAPNTALRWTAHEPTNDLLGLMRVNRASDVSSFAAALSELRSPQLNFALAARSGDIGIWHTGMYPIRRQDVRWGVKDGTRPQDEWGGWIPREHLPTSINPQRGWVSSANQKATDATYPYYMIWDFVSVDRASRINEELARLDNATTEDMKQLQLDVFNRHAREVLPTMLASVDQSQLAPDVRLVYNELAAWDYQHVATSTASRVFAYWWAYLYDAIWDDNVQREGGNLAWPSRDVTRYLLTNFTEHPVYDNVATEKNESLGDVALASLVTTVEKMTEAFGPFGAEWNTGTSRGTTIGHLGRIPSFGRRVATGGTNTTVNATKRTSGPSWRMVASLETPIRAWTIYPGGQSGNPGSRYYDSMVSDWVKGKYREAVFLTAPDQRDARIIGRTVLTPEAGE